jgi:hypothetical protein
VRAIRRLVSVSTSPRLHEGQLRIAAKLQVKERRDRTRFSMVHDAEPALDHSGLDQQATAVYKDDNCRHLVKGAFDGEGANRRNPQRPPELPRPCDSEGASEHQAERQEVETIRECARTAGQLGQSEFQEWHQPGSESPPRLPGIR